jgi:predicted HTH transcriptional regulator
MFTELEIETLLNNTENEMVEFKRDLTGIKGLMKDICAFANSKEGYIILGIEDSTRKVVGVNKEEIFELEERIANLISDHFDNRPVYIVRIINYKGKILLCLKITSGELVPYFIKSADREGGTYIRLGSSSRLASVEELAELERRRQNISFDAIEFIQANKNDLDYDFIEKTMEKIALKRNIVKQAPSDRLLESLKIIKKAGNQYVPTVGGILLFAYKEKMEEYFPYARVKCARFKGNNSIEYIDKKEFSGSLLHQVEDTMKFYKINEPKAAKIEGLYREEYYKIPEVMVREAVVNAIVHRNYGITGSDIKFNIYDDYIEIISPGRLPFGITKQDLGKGISEVRNKVIAKMFLELDLIEQWGQGISRILMLSEELGLQTPLFEELSNFFKVTLYKTQKEKAKENKKDLFSLNFKNFPVEKIAEIIKYAEDNEFIVNSKCQEILGVNDYQSKHILDRLVREGFLEPSGKGKGRKYILKNPEG